MNLQISHQRAELMSKLERNRNVYDYMLSKKLCRNVLFCRFIIGRGRNVTSTSPIRSIQENFEQGKFWRSVDVTPWT